MNRHKRRFACAHIRHSPVYTRYLPLEQLSAPVPPIKPSRSLRLVIAREIVGPNLGWTSGYQENSPTQSPTLPLIS